MRPARKSPLDDVEVASHIMTIMGIMCTMSLSVSGPLLSPASREGSRTKVQSLFFMGVTASAEADPRPVISFAIFTLVVVVVLLFVILIMFCELQSYLKRRLRSECVGLQ